jgi:lipopolysaccharide core heptose(I) kinase
MERALADKSTRSQYFVQPEYESLLLANQLADAKDILSLGGGTVVRSVPGRTTRRIELKSPDGTILAAYLKYYECAPPWPYRWLGLAGRTENGLESLNEWHQILALRKLGFRTAAPIAAGWEQAGPAGAIRSFVLTAEIGGAVSGYDYWAAGSGSQRRALIRRIAGLAQRFHQAGFIHKDFYLNHIFVAERADGLELTLIDLQRVLGPRTFRTRWRVKDFGALLFSLEKAGAKRAELLRLFKLYQGGQRLGTAEKIFLWRSLGRAARLHRHKPKYGEPESK